MLPAINNSLKLPDDQYFSSGNYKTGICLHHTCGSSATSTIDWWKRDTQMVGTAFIVDRDGTIYQAFDPLGWAYQFGLKWKDPDRLNFEKRFIGIEIASEGGLIENNGSLYCFDTISPRTIKKREEAFDYGKVYRGYRYFDKYEQKQIDSVVQLVNYLCDNFNIERKLPVDYMNFYGDQLKNFRGIIGHVNVRLDKSDPAPDKSFWQNIIAGCNLQLIDAASSEAIPTSSPAINVAAPEANVEIVTLTEVQIQNLFQENLIQFSKMNRAAGNMVKGLLWELQDGGRNTYIRLKDAVIDGHVVFYEIVQGNEKFVPLAAQSLGFKSWDNNRLEVYNA